ncbi:MAG: hypothetical protein KIS94_00600 [Chitinophagales bacterium]|nr:hypothetical protein [Chitinophagales bacterium]
MGSYQSYQERASNAGYVSSFESRSKWGYGWDNTHPVYSKVGGFQREFLYEWTANNEGLKGDTLKVEKSGARIMIFGDSFTESMGAPTDSAYPQLVQHLIRSSGDSTTQVINCGTAGGDVFTEYMLLKGKMLKYRPDVVIVTFNSTDLYEFTVRGGFERFKPDNKVEYRTPPWFEPIYARSYLVRVVVHDILKYDSRFLRPTEAVAMDSLSIKNNIAVIDSFRALCSTINCQFGMVFHPMQNEFLEETEYGNAPIISYCRKQQIPYIDNFDCMKNAGINSKNIHTYYWPIDGHYKVKGYEVMAQCAFELLTQNKWLEQ